MNALVPVAGPIRTPIRIRHDVRIRLAQVVRVEILSPRMRRIVLGGDDLADFSTAAPDDHVKLFFAAPGQDKPTLPTMGPGGRALPAGAACPIARDYTPRRFDAASGTLTIEFVLHGHGPAASWARSAVPGQWLGIAGPRGSQLVPEDYDTYLLAGDETALPAIARRLEEMQPGARAIALIEIENGDEERHLPTAANASVQWLHRNGRPAGTSDQLERALRSVQLPNGDTHAWLAGEIETIRRLRTHLIEDRSIQRTDIKAAGYWRLGVAGAHGKLD